MGIFAKWQPEYAERGVPTFPVTGKRPAVRGYLKAGHRASREYAAKFKDADALGFAVQKAGITVLDVDASDETVLADALDEQGKTPLVVRSGSGNFQAWYRHNGEGRHVRPWPDQPIDVLGHGYIVAPPSLASRGRYELLQGSLDDIHDLPPMAAPPGREEPLCASESGTDGTVHQGRRNNALFGFAMRAARQCQTRAELLVAAQEYAGEHFTPALPDAEIDATVTSAWDYTLRGENFAGQRRVVSTHVEIDTLLYDQPDAFLLLQILRRYHWGRTFCISNAMADEGAVPFNRKRLSRARKYLEMHGYVVKLRGHSPDAGPALYQWPTPNWPKSTRNKIQTPSPPLPSPC